MKGRFGIAKWERALDADRLKCVLDGDYELESEQPEEVLVLETASCPSNDA